MTWLSHRIAIDPTNVQATYFAKACGVARLAYNWALAEWKEQYAMGGKPRERELRRFFNSIKDERFPFVREVTKCAPQNAISNLGDAFKNFFAGRAKYPSFKKKGIHDSFEIDNSVIAVDGMRVNVPCLGWVRMREELRFIGKILFATVSRTAGRWFISITVEMPGKQVAPNEGPAVGIDFGCTNFATLSTGEPSSGICVRKIRRKRDRGRYMAWAGIHSVIGTYATAGEAREAARVVLETRDVPRLCGLRDIDAARKVMAAAGRKATVRA